MVVSFNYFFFYTKLELLILHCCYYSIAKYSFIRCFSLHFLQFTQSWDSVKNLYFPLVFYQFDTNYSIEFALFGLATETSCFFADLIPLHSYPLSSRHPSSDIAHNVPMCHVSNEGKVFTWCTSVPSSPVALISLYIFVHSLWPINT